MSGELNVVTASVAPTLASKANPHMPRCMNGTACYKTNDPAHTAKFSHEKTSVVCKNAYIGCTNAYCLYTHPAGTTAPSVSAPSASGEPRREYKPYNPQQNKLSGYVTRVPSQQNQPIQPSNSGPSFIPRQNPPNLIANPYDINKAYGVPKPSKYNIRKEIFDTDSESSSSSSESYDRSDRSDRSRKSTDKSVEKYQNKISELKYVNNELATELAETKAELAKMQKKLAAIKTKMTEYSNNKSHSHRR